MGFDSQVWQVRSGDDPVAEILIAHWERVHDEIRRRVSLVSPEGPVPEFLLHIEGDRAWFRWSDKPFDD